jgi:hypothetical protein
MTKPFLVNGFLVEPPSCRVSCDHLDCMEANYRVTNRDGLQHHYLCTRHMIGRVAGVWIQDAPVLPQEGAQEASEPETAVDHGQVARRAQEAFQEAQRRLVGAKACLAELERRYPRPVPGLIFSALLSAADQVVLAKWQVREAAKAWVDASMACTEASHGVYLGVLWDEVPGGEDE